MNVYMSTNQISLQQQLQHSALLSTRMCPVSLNVRGQIFLYVAPFHDKGRVYRRQIRTTSRRDVIQLSKTILLQYVARHDDVVLDLTRVSSSPLYLFFIENERFSQ